VPYILPSPKIAPPPDMRSQVVNIDLGERALHDRARAGFLWLLQPRRGRGDYGKRTGARGQRAACARCHRRRASRPSLLRSSRPPAVYADCCTSRRRRSAATATAPPASASSGPALAASARASACATTRATTRLASSLPAARAVVPSHRRTGTTPPHRSLRQCRRRDAPSRAAVDRPPWASCRAAHRGRPIPCARA
jgi:hypothetical protein